MPANYSRTKRRLAAALSLEKKERKFPVLELKSPLEIPNLRLFAHERYFRTHVPFFVFTSASIPDQLYALLFHQGL